jgi:hypothetical protein
MALRHVNSTLLFTPLLALFSLAASPPGRAQAITPAPETALLAANNLDRDAASVTDATSETTAADPAAQATGTTTSEPTGKEDDQWHIAVTPFLWVPGVYGTVGYPDRDLRLHASAGDLISHFRFGLMGTVEARRKWLVVPLDMIWARLGDNHPIPLESGVTTANFKAQLFILTPKIGIRFVNQEKIKVDFVTGFRYWHVAESLAFNPSSLGLSFSNSLNWVDPMVGGRIQTALSPKIVLNLLGDVGGWGTGSLIEYDVAGLLGYKVNPKWTLLGGYAYLRVDYRSGPFLLNIHMPGGIYLAATINLK